MAYGKRSYRRRTYKRRPMSKRSRARSAVAKAKTKSLVKLIKSVHLRQCETKKTQTEVCKDQQLTHNYVQVIETNIFATVQGDENHQRDGDKIFAKYAKFRMYFENQQYRPFASYLILVIQNKNSPATDIVNGENLWEGVTTSKNLDYIDYNKYRVLYRKRVNVGSMANNWGTKQTMGSGGVDGMAAAWSDTSQPQLIGNVSRYFNFKIRLNRTIQYLDGNTNATSTMNYALVIIPYSSYTTTTNGTVYPVGHVSCVEEFFFKDP